MSSVKQSNKSLDSNNLEAPSSNNCHETYIKSNDVANKYVDLKFQFIFTFIGWSLLFISAHDGNGYFVSKLMLCIPLFKWFVEYTPQDIVRKSVRKLSILFVILNILIGVLGVTNVLIVSYIDEIAYINMGSNNLVRAQVNIPLFYSWIFCGSMPFFTLMDYWCRVTPREHVLNVKQIDT